MYFFSICYSYWARARMSARMWITFLSYRSHLDRRPWSAHDSSRDLMRHWALRCDRATRARRSIARHPTRHCLWRRCSNCRPSQRSQRSCRCVCCPHTESNTTSKCILEKKLFYFFENLFFEIWKLKNDLNRSDDRHFWIISAQLLQRELVNFAVEAFDLRRRSRWLKQKNTNKKMLQLLFFWKQTFKTYCVGSINGTGKWLRT